LKGGRPAGRPEGKKAVLIFFSDPTRKGGRVMSRKIRWRFLGIVAMFSFLLVSPGHAGEGWKKTIPLSSGEVVCDLSGVWDYRLISRGMTSTYSSGAVLDIIEITQEGSSFKGIRLRGSHYALKGEVAVEGEVDKNGIKKMYHRYGSGGLSAGFYKAELVSDGNIIEINEREFALELSRK
jgi:hypothetical protein